MSHSIPCRHSNESSVRMPLVHLIPVLLSLHVVLVLQLQLVPVLEDGVHVEISHAPQLRHSSQRDELHAPLLLDARMK